MSEANIVEASVDIETLATSNDAMVISIGVAFFNADGIIAKSDLPLMPADWVGKIDNDTVSWWMQQPDAARRATFSGGGTTGSVCRALCGLFLDFKPKTVWANDPDFDLTILRDWWDRQGVDSYGLEIPFHFRQHRSYRTIKDLASRAGFVYSPVSEGESTRHNAGADAARQALYIIEATKFLTRSRNP